MYMKYLSKNRIKGIIFVLAYILFVIVVWYYVSSFLVDKEAVRNIVTSYGSLSPIVFILIQIIQNIVAPIAHYPILLAGGFIFGPILGFFYNWIGTTIGTFLIIFLVKKFGRPLVEKMVSKKFIDKYDSIVKKLTPFGLFIIYFLPGFPDDEISYLVALSSLPTKSILIAIILGKTGGASLSFIGDSLANGTAPMLIINVVILLIGVLFYFWKNIIKALNSAILKS